MIRVTHLRKTFGSVTAVADVSFDARDGQILGLLGPNGAGKTTTLRALAGLLRPDAGSVEVEGIDVRDDPGTARRHLGLLPDARGLYPRLTARENVRYFGELQGMERSSIEASITSLAERLDMQDIVDRRVEGFSQGERAKVAIARALVHGPKNVVLDEPTNGLDVMSTRAMRDFIRQLKDDGKCVLFSSHVMQEVSALCDALVVVSQGRVVAHGSLDEVREHTGFASLEDAFVALTQPGAPAS